MRRAGSIKSVSGWADGQIGLSCLVCRLSLFPSLPLALDISRLACALNLFWGAFGGSLLSFRSAETAA